MSNCVKTDIVSKEEKGDDEEEYDIDEYMSNGPLIDPRLGTVYSPTESEKEDGMGEKNGFISNGSLIDPRLGAMQNPCMYRIRMLAFPIEGECPIARVKRTMHETYYSIHYERMSKGLNDYYEWKETPIYKELNKELKEFAQDKIRTWILSVYDRCGNNK
jgi:hypothetical protein